MKATKSRDGERRFTVNVTFRVGRDVMEDILAREISTYGEPKLSRKEIMKVVRKWLKSDGDEVTWMDEERFEKGSQARAAEMVNKIFPEL